MELNDNTQPAQKGSSSIGATGIINYYPVQTSDTPMQPFLALVLWEKPDGEIVSTIDVRWPNSALLSRIED